MGYHLANEFVTVTYNVQMVTLSPSVRATLTASLVRHLRVPQASSCQTEVTALVLMQTVLGRHE